MKPLITKLAATFTALSFIACTAFVLTAQTQRHSSALRLEQVRTDHVTTYPYTASPQGAQFVEKVY